MHYTAEKRVRETVRSPNPKFALVQDEGGRSVERRVEHYNLDLILSVRYRVKSTEGLYQTFDGEELYVRVQEKAANLLYQVVKNYPFGDDNKRCAAALFVYFLDRNGMS